MSPPAPRVECQYECGPATTEHDAIGAKSARTRRFRLRPRWQTSVMPPSDAKADLHEYLQTARGVMLWKLDGLTEYDMRRPLVPTGTNLLGLVRHTASIETG